MLTEPRQGWGRGRAALAAACLLAGAASAEELPSYPNEVYFGDTHVHTRLSMDANTQDTRMSPADAYRFARGERVGISPFDAQGNPLRHVQLVEPLDFVALSDHAEFLGEIAICDPVYNQTDPHPAHGSVECEVFRRDPERSFLLFNFLLATGPTNLPTEPKRVRRFPFCGLDNSVCTEAGKKLWQEVQDAANAANAPDADPPFTAFIGYEWSGSPTVRNLHRNVLFANEHVPDIPLGYMEAPDPEILWAGLEEGCAPPCDVLTVPHNSNLSSGLMFRTVMSNGEPFDADYVATRRAMEPLVEIFQHKGDSECFRLRGAGKNDELCGFEKFPYNNLIADRFDGFMTAPPKERDFVRDALKVGLQVERELGTNPFEYGIIASTDTHRGTPGMAVEGAKFPGHGGAGQATRGQLPAGLTESVAFNPGGLAAVWARANTREEIFAAMKRRETYGTSGPRINVRFFGSWGYPKKLCEKSGDQFLKKGYGLGSVPMGGILGPRPSSDAKPTFAVRALKAATRAAIAPESAGDPGDLGGMAEPGTRLERVQIIKGWLDGERKEEAVFEVAWAAGIGTAERVRVDPATCEPMPRGEDPDARGADELCAVWADEAFEADEPAFYYARVVENETCRWTALQCNAAGIVCGGPDPVPEEWAGCCDESFPKTIQERAWTSPIWYKAPAAPPAPAS